MAPSCNHLQWVSTVPWQGLASDCPRALADSGGVRPCLSLLFSVAACSALPGSDEEGFTCSSSTWDNFLGVSWFSHPSNPISDGSFTKGPFLTYWAEGALGRGLRLLHHLPAFLTAWVTLEHLICLFSDSFLSNVSSTGQRPGLLAHLSVQVLNSSCPEEALESCVSAEHTLQHLRAELSTHQTRRDGRAKSSTNPCCACRSEAQSHEAWGALAASPQTQPASPQDASPSIPYK